MRTQTAESGAQILKLAALQSLLNVVWRTRNADEMPLWVLVKLDCRSSVRIQAPTEKADINIRGHVSSEEMLLAIRLSANLSLHKGELPRILSEKRKCFLEIGLNQIIVPYFRLADRNCHLKTSMHRRPGLSDEAFPERQAICHVRRNSYI